MVTKLMAMPMLMSMPTTISKISNQWKIMPQMMRIIMLVQKKIQCHLLESNKYPKNEDGNSKEEKTNYFGSAHDDEDSDDGGVFFQSTKKQDTKEYLGDEEVDDIEKDLKQIGKSTLNDKQESKDKNEEDNKQKKKQRDDNIFNDEPQEEAQRKLVIDPTKLKPGAKLPPKKDPFADTLNEGENDIFGTKKDIITSDNKAPKKRKK